MERLTGGNLGEGKGDGETRLVPIWLYLPGLPTKEGGGRLEIGTLLSVI